MKTKITSIFALALLITACSNDNDPINGGQGGDEKTEIKLGTTVTTRASVESNSGGVITVPTSLDVAFLRAPDHTSATASVNVWNAAVETAQSVPGTGSGIINAVLQNVENKNVLTFATPQYYNIDKDLYSHLKGYHPRTTLTKSTNVSATWTIDGATDVMVTDYFNQNKDISTGSVAVQFRHLLSKVTIKVIADSEVAATSWGDVTKIVIEDAPTQVTHVFNGDKDDEYTSSVTLTPVTDITICDVDGNRVLNADANARALATDTATFGKAMVYPADEYNLAVTTSGGVAPVRVKAVIDGGAQAGMDHEITLTFKSGEIIPSTTVKPWEEGGKGSATID